MTTNNPPEDEAREWANHRCPEQGPEFIVWCMRKEDYLEGHKRGYARALEEVLVVINKWADDNWIPSPTHDDSFWQNNLISELRKRVKIFKSKGGA